MSGFNLLHLLILLGLSVVTVGLLRRAHLPPILGYLFVGILTGPHALNWIPESDEMAVIGQLGLVFLLFMIGLEIPIPQLAAMRRALFLLGGLQVVLSTAVGGYLAWTGGIPWQGALVVGGALALSSTAIVARQLSDQLELHSRHGRLALGILLFQDLAVVPFLIVIPILAGGSGAMGAELSLAAAKAVLVLAAMLLVGRKLVRPMFALIARAHSVELFTLSILLVALTSASLTHLAGLSHELGAFVAGMLIADTEYRHHVEIETRPFRDVLMGLFFITVGMQLDPAAVPTIAHWILLLVAGIVLGKGLLVAVLVRLEGYETGVAVRTGLVMAQAGEFGFALLALALDKGLLSLTQAQPVLAAAIITMVIAPVLVRFNGPLAKRFCDSYRSGRASQTAELASQTAELENHVILCGFGRIGQNLGLFLEREARSYVALDVDAALIGDAYEGGKPVFYGDATHPEILEAAGIGRAAALVVAMHEHQFTERILHNARRLSPDLPIIVLTDDDRHLDSLEQAGANAVVPGSMETSLTLAARLLATLGIADHEIQLQVERVRAEHYRHLRGYFHGVPGEPEQLGSADEAHLHSVAIPAGSPVAGQALGSLGLTQHGVRVAAVRRGNISGDDPAGDFQLQEGDVLILEGTAEALERSERLLRG